MTQEDLNQVLNQGVQGDTGLGEAFEEVGLSSVVGHFEVDNPAFAVLVVVSRVHLDNSCQELASEELEQVVERSEVASYQELDHQHHELDQPNQAELEQGVQMEYLVLQLVQDPDQPWQQHSQILHVTLPEGEGLQQSWKSPLHL